MNDLSDKKNFTIGRYIFMLALSLASVLILLIPKFIDLGAGLILIMLYTIYSLPYIMIYNLYIVLKHYKKAIYIIPLLIVYVITLLPQYYLISIDMLFNGLSLSTIFHFLLQIILFVTVIILSFTDKNN